MAGSAYRQQIRKRSSGTIIFRKTAFASAIATALAPVTVLHAADWGRNIQIFVNPSSKRTLAGGALLQPVWQDADSMAYVDFRGIFSPGRTDEFNLGLGYRRMVGDRRWILGGYASMDTRNSITDHRHNQITVGAEALSEQWDLRGNYYFPLTDEKLLFTTPSSASGTPYFTGFDLIQPLIQGTRTYEEALQGFDVEGGSLLPFIPVGEARIYIGAYHFDGETVKSTGTGLRARLEFRPRKDIVLGIVTRHDRLFGTETTFQIKYSFGYKPEGGVRSLDERMIQFVQRDIDIRETSSLPYNKRSEIDPTQPTLETVSKHVVHIDNTAAAGGDGSFEHPFNSIAACEAEYAGYCGTEMPSSIVYVWAGDGTSTGLDQTLPLHSYQTLIGQGYAWQPVAGGGTIGGDAYPVLNPGGGIGIQLANHTEIAGLKITNAGSAISGTNGLGFNIHDNQLVNNSTGIAFMHSASGSTISGGTIANNTITGNTTGISLINQAGSAGDTAGMTADISGNTVTGNQMGIVVANAAKYGGKAMQTVNLANNTVSNNAAMGMVVYNIGFGVTGPDVSSATQTINVTGGNQFNGNGQNGAAFISVGKYAAGAAQTVNLSGGNAFNDNSKYGAFIANAGYGYGTSTQTVNAADGTNTFNNNTYSGALLINYGVTSGSGTQSVDLSGNNQLSGNNYYGIGIGNYVDATGTGIQSVNLTGSDLSGNTPGACYAKYSGAGASTTITGASCP